MNAFGNKYFNIESGERGVEIVDFSTGDEENVTIVRYV